MFVIWICVDNYLVKLSNFLLFVLSVLQSLHYAYFSFLGCSEWWDRSCWKTERSIVRYFGGKCSLFLHTFFKTKQHSKVILFFWLTPPLMHSSSSQPSSTSHEKQWKSSSVLETKKYFYLFSIKYSGSTNPLGTEAFWATTLRLDQQLLNFNLKK